jgi:spore germination protein GerM
VATRRKKKKTAPQMSQVTVILWLIFIIIIISVSMINAETIKRNFNIFRTRMAHPSGSEEILEEDLTENITEIIDEHPAISPEPRTERVEVVEQPRTPEIATPPPETPEPLRTPDPPAERPAQPVQQPQAEQQPPPVQTRDRTIYFSAINADRVELAPRSIRRLPLTQTPMQDVLNALLEGPTAVELNHGIINMIPQNTRLLSATIRGDTAYINFSEDFMFNVFGVEGFVAQLRQIVWSVTEFQNINDVQILIEGRRMDYLGDGIWIGSPINRQSF